MTVNLWTLLLAFGLTTGIIGLVGVFFWRQKTTLLE